MATTHRTGAARLGILTMALASVACADDRLLGLSLEELSNLTVHIATGTAKSLPEAPAATSIITAEELAAMNARSLDDALESVPGVHVSRGSFQYAPRYFIRGITSTYNPQTLFLVNGIPMTSLFLGDRGERLPGRHSLPVADIQRIEIIRGPGSAMYGADAFAGVINVITKGPEDLAGGMARATVGSGNTGEMTLLQPLALSDWQGLVMVDALRSDGGKAVIASDLQSHIDALGPGPAVSQAPDRAGLALQYWQLRTEWQRDNWRWRASWLQVNRSGVGQGINDSLDRGASFQHRRGTFDSGWQGRAGDWQLDTQFAYLYGEFTNPTSIYVFPPGAFFGQFPDGVIGKPELFEENARLGMTALYQELEKHDIRLGGGLFWGDIYKTGDNTNYFVTPTAVVPRANGRIDISDTGDVFMPEDQRTGAYLFAQDEWAVAPHWSLTSGLRHDRFSDVAGATTPRLGLVWHVRRDLTAKLLYGEAFRAPTLFELRATSNPVALGNPQLKPERLRSTELALAWRPGDTLMLDLNLYSLRIRDYIDFVSDPGGQTFRTQNVGRIHGQGLEAEMRYQWRPDWQWIINYSLQDTETVDNDMPIGLAPRRKLYLRTAYDWTPGWQGAVQLTAQGSTSRPAGDNRPPLAGYVSADLTVQHRWSSALDSALSLRNLNDADIREASRGPAPGQAFAAFTGDLPQVRRSLWLSGTLRW